MKFFFKHIFIKFEFGQEIFQDEKNYLLNIIFFDKTII